MMNCISCWSWFASLKKFPQKSWQRSKKYSPILCLLAETFKLLIKRHVILLHCRNGDVSADKNKLSFLLFQAICVFTHQIGQLTKSMNEGVNVFNRWELSHRQAFPVRFTFVWVKVFGGMRQKTANECDCHKFIT